MKQNKVLFTNRDILRLLVPLFVEQLLFMMVGVTDTVMVASLGAASISAVSLADMFNTFLCSVFFALATGGAVVVSQNIGANNLTRARASAKQLLVVVFLVGTMVSILCELFLPWIVNLLFGKLEKDVYAATITYFRITLLSLPLISVYGGCTALFRSMNQAKTTMYIAFFSNLINVLGNAILIFWCGLGVAGAAYATLISRFVSLVIGLLLIMNPSRQIYVSFRTGFRVSLQLVKKILYIGIPGGIENGVFQFGRVVVLGLIASYGTREIAANAVANTIDYIGCILGGAFSLAVVTVIGQAVGAGDPQQVRYYTWKMMKFACSSHFIWNVFIFLLTPLILNWFGKLDADTRHLALILIIIHNGVGMFIWPMSFVFPNILRSMNDVRWPMAISITSMIVVRIGLSYLLAKPLNSGVLAVWIAMLFDWVVRIVCFVLRYRSGAWLRLSHFKTV